MAISNTFSGLGELLLMLVLLVCSAFFSGSETAFFNLSRRQLKLFKTSGHKLQNLTANLLARPGQLLGSLLLGNMVVNVLFFAAASVLAVRVERQFGVTGAAVIAVTSFCVLVLFGEILPKSFAYANSKSFSIAAAVPAVLCRRLFTPVLFIFRFLAVEPILRLLLGPVRHSAPIRPEEFRTLIDKVSKRGLISDEENKLLAEIIELGVLKVSNVMQPRVDMVVCDVKQSRQKARERMQQNNLTKLPVYAGKIDNIIGIIHMRQLLLEPETPLGKLLQQANYVPEQTIESLLEFFRNSGTDTAIVVDEYGGIAGSICLEDIAEELLGPLETNQTDEPIKQLGLSEYRLAGSLAIHDWASVFGIDPARSRVYTIGGLVTALLGKIPKQGDVAQLRNLKFTVEQMQRHRIKSVILTVEPVENNA